jgi:hypothetical protein
VERREDEDDEKAARKTVRVDNEKLSPNMKNLF